MGGGEPPAPSPLPGCLRVYAYASCGPCPRRPGRLGRWVPAPPPPRERDRGWALRAPPSVGRLPSQRGQVFSPGYSGEQNAPVPRDPRVCGAGSRAPAIPAEACQGFEPPHPDRSSHRSRPPGNRTTPRGPPILGSGWGLSVSPSRTPMGRGLETPESWGWAGWLAYKVPYAACRKIPCPSAAASRAVGPQSIIPKCLCRSGYQYHK